jgi:hypothetical protein
LLQGEYVEGFRAYEARLLTNNDVGPLRNSPQWDGSPLEGRTLLLEAEQGLGDTIQFVRYAAVLREQNPKSIELVCHPALKTLLAGQCGIDRVYAFDEDIPDPGWDYWTPPLSIPHYCKTTLDTVPPASCTCALAERMAPAALPARRRTEAGQCGKVTRASKRHRPLVAAGNPGAAGGDRRNPLRQPAKALARTRPPPAECD